MNPNNIKRLRKQKGLSVTVLAQMAGMSQSNLTKIENNQIELKQTTALTIAQALGVELNEITKGDTKKENINSIKEIENQDKSSNTSIKIPQLWLKSPKIKDNHQIGSYIAYDDTMTPKIEEGDIALVNKEITTFRENGIYLIKINNKTMIRILQQTIDNQINLLTENKSYQKETTTLNTIEIIGKIEGVIKFTTI